jgi:UDP-3-O-[3-hydroxymyristoyl] N-acetylglucosamine deacetylase
MRRQKTLRGTTELVGHGLHTAMRVRLRLRPAPPGVGIAFVRDDLGVAVAATLENVRSVDHATVVGNSSAQVRTVEHVLAALAACGVSNAFVSVDGPEVPIVDGSGLPFLELIAGAGILEQEAELPVLRVTQPLRVSDSDGWIELRPADSLSVDCSIHFSEKAIGHQRLALEVNPATFATAIAPARTFGFLREKVELREHGLAAGATLDNCVVVDRGRVLSGPLRFRDEFVRHKVLDLLGDLALLGCPVHAEVVARRAGHALRMEALHALLAAPDCYELGAEDAAARVHDAGIGARPVRLGMAG